MVEPRPGLTPPQDEPGTTEVTRALAGAEPQRLERLFRHIRTQQEGSYLFDLMVRHRKQRPP